MKKPMPMSAAITVMDGACNHAILAAFDFKILGGSIDR